MNFKNIIMKLKVYLDRGRVYASIISFSGTIFLVIAQFKNFGFDIDLSLYTIPILVLGFASIILIGFFDDKFKFFAEELNIRSWKNPMVVKQFGKYDEINKKLDILLEMRK